MKTPLPLEALEPWFRRDDLTLDDLVEAASGLLARLAPTQARHKVRARPDVRTIRYYTSQGLLPRPLRYAGGRARYGGEHLLRLLWIKQRQAEHLSLARIRLLIADQSLEAITRDLTGGVARQPEAPPAAPGSAPAAVEADPQPVLRFAIEHDDQLLANVDIPQAAFHDPRLRRVLARKLADLADRLSGSDPTPAPHPEETP